MVAGTERLTAALVLETNNLRGGGADDAQRVATSLDRLLRRLRAQTRPLASLEEVVVTHDGLPPALQAALPPADLRLRFLELPPGTDYYEAKNRGFAATDADVVVFGDSDCWPDPRWLDELLTPLERDGDAQVVAGRTTYRADLLGTAATTIDFMYFPSPLGPGCTRNFYANNVAFRRELFAARRFPTATDIYRGPCQLLGLRLQREGIPVRYAPAAHTVHRFPDSARELLQLRLMRGQDASELTPHLADSYLPRRLRWLGRLGPLSAGANLTARLGFSLASLGRQGLPPARGVRRLQAMGLIVGLSAIDGLGATARATGLRTPDRGGAHSNAVLSYHGDRDGLDRSAAA